MGLLSKEFEKLEGLTVALNTSLRNIGADASGLRGIAAAGQASNRALAAASQHAATLERHLVGIRAASAGGIGLPPIVPGIGSHAAGGGLARFIPGPGGGGGPGGPGAQGPGGRGGAGAGGHGGGPGGGGFHGGNIHMGPRGVGLGTVGMAAGDWFWPLAATGAAIYGGKALYESAKELNTEQNKLKLFGLTQQQNQQAFDFVKRLQVYGTTQIERMTAFREAQGVFRESGESGSKALQGAMLATPVLAKLNFLASSLDEESAAKLKTANMSMLRYIDSSGGINSASEFNRLADFGFKLNQSSGGTVNWEQLRQFRARAGAAGYSITNEGLARLEPIIGENKGGAVGFGVSTAFNRLTGTIRIPNQVIQELIKFGLWDKNKIAFNSNGGIKRFLGNPLGADKTKELTEDPVLFYEKYIKPVYTKMKFDSAEIARQNVMLFGTTGGRNMNIVEKQMVAIERSITALRKAKGINDSVNQMRDSLSGQEKEFSAAWKDFKTQWGTTMLPFFTGLLKGGAALLRPLPKEDDIGGMSSFGKGWHYIFRNLGFLNPPNTNTPFVPTSGIGRIPSHSHDIVVDGRKLGATVSSYQSKAANAPQTGTGSFDGRLALTPAGH